MDEGQLIPLLKEKGFKITPQRLEICNIVFKSSIHPTADYVYREVTKIYPSISQATVYNTLNLLVNLEILTELPFTNTHTRYDTNTGVHINIVCKNCGRITDYESDNINELYNNLIKDLGDIEGQRFDIYRTCENCLNEKRTKLNRSN